MAAELNSVPIDIFKDVVAFRHDDWKLGTDDTISVYNIFTDKTVSTNEKIEVHFSLIKDPTKMNVTKFHFTVRVGDNKGNDAFIWYTVKGHNKDASFQFDGQQGNLDLTDINIPLGVKDLIRRAKEEYVVELQKDITNKCPSA